MWFWVLLIGLIGLGVYFGFTLRDIWRAAKRLFLQAGKLGEVASTISIPVRDLIPVTDVYDDPARRRAAREDRRRIRAERASRRNRRLNAARGRWEAIDETSFESIGSTERERARAQVKERRR